MKGCKQAPEQHALEFFGWPPWVQDRFRLWVASKYDGWHQPSRGWQVAQEAAA